MIFSEKKWNIDKEIQQIIPTSAALSWNKMQASLRNAQDEYLLVLLGTDMTAKIEEIYAADPLQRSEKDTKLLYLSQKAVANIAMWTDFDALNLRITDQGFQRQESESGDFTGAYKYQEDNLRNNFKNKGFNALDAVLAFLEENVADYDAFKSSPAYTVSQKSLVKNTEEIQQIFYIQNSRIIFLRLHPVIEQVEELSLQPILGDDLFAKLQKWLSGTLQWTNTDITFDDFRMACAKVVIMKAVLSLLRTTGSITDRGLYFEQTQVQTPGNESRTPVSDTRLELAVADATNAIQEYTARLMRLVSTYMADDAAGNPLHALDRDNSGCERKAFWA